MITNSLTEIGIKYSFSARIPLEEKNQDIHIRFVFSKIIFPKLTATFFLIKDVKSNLRTHSTILLILHLKHI